MNQLELLNDGECILKVVKREDRCYGIYNQKNCIGILTAEELNSFLQGKTHILDNQGTVWNYSEYSESIKPPMSKTFEFMRYIE